MKFSALSVVDLKMPEGKSDWIVFDDDSPGLGLRLRAGGSRVWIFQYALGDKQRRMTIGSAKTLKLGDVRKSYATLHAKVRLGQDPASDKAGSRKRAAETFGVECERFLSYQKAELRPGSFAEVERHMRRHAKPLHEMQLASVDRRSIANTMEEVAKGSGKVTSNRVRSTLSAFFGWLIERGIAETNPVIGTRRFEERSRERVLSSEEMRIIWAALADDHYSTIIRLLMLTMQRADEIASIRRSEICDGIIKLPPNRTKNGREHWVPLSAPALSIIEAQPRRCDADGCVRDLFFGLRQAGFSGWSGGKEQLDVRIAEMSGSIPHWTPHDLRRTGATGMAELGVLPHVREAVLNHVGADKAGVAGIYNRATYLPEKRQALALWANYVLSAVEGRPNNVAVLRSA